MFTRTPLVRVSTRSLIIIIIIILTVLSDRCREHVIVDTRVSIERKTVETIAGKVSFVDELIAFAGTSSSR